MLDPHPATDVPLSGFSVSTKLPVRLQAFESLIELGFQAATNDPPIVVPGNVDAVEVYYQTTNAAGYTGTDAYEPLLKLWGVVPDLGNVPAIGLANVQDITDPSVGHSEVHELYQQQIVPLLGHVDAIHSHPSAAGAGPQTKEPSLDATTSGGTASLYPALVDDPNVAQQLLADIGAVMTDYDQGNLSDLAAGLQTLSQDLAPAAVYSHP